MKKLTIVILAIMLSAPAWAQDSKETLELKLNALQWEFKSHQSTLTLLQKRMEEIKAEAAKIQAGLKALADVKKDVPKE